MTVKIRPYRNGGYEVDIMTRLPNGKSHRERRKSPHSSKAASLRWGRERERYLLVHGPTRRASGEDTAQPKKEVPTFTEFAPRYVEGQVKGNGAKPSHTESIERHLRIHILPAFGDKRLDELEQEDLERFKAKLGETRKNKTINNIQTTLSTLLKAAVAWKVIEEVPVEIKRLRVVRKKMDFFDFDEFAWLREFAAKAPSDGIDLAIVLLGGDAGLRAGEIRGLHWDSLDFQRNRLTVERAEWHGHITTPKHDKIRVLPMTQRLNKALRQLPRECKLVLPQPSGEPLTAGLLDKRLRRVEKRAGLRDKGPHTLRHTFCSHLAMRGIPARVIQQLAGHSSLVTTERYMHLSPGATTAAIAALEAPPPHQEITKPDE
ncbi:Phage integrase [Plesiocystis pacifica SIR-1]|uniref:Phage integrase n=1 Tax=Plesiocystis pacifica SIR-1 TaxID=391625 RepID=A6GDZ0_9BACT|nr:tyrosine-type recombinase/integrase [Plesiocystis pacifica]EDM75939.1 Phage integrase [Plesiocystis pacifica SIR-1]